MEMDACMALQHRDGTFIIPLFERSVTAVSCEVPSGNILENKSS